MVHAVAPSKLPDNYWQVLIKIRAIMSRELRSRYTGDRLGYLWTYIVPLTWIAVIYVIFQILGRRSPIDTDIGSFIFSGVLPYLSARFTINALIRARTAYRHIMTLPTVSPSLIYASVFLLELFNSFLIFIILLLANFAAFGNLEMNQPTVVIWGFFLAIATGGAFGYLMVSLSQHSAAYVRATPIILRPLFYISGVFYTANEIPPSMIGWIIWNPLLHAIEILRSGQFIAYQSSSAQVWIPMLFILVVIALGFFFGRKIQHSDDGDDTSGMSVL